ncbi:MAG: hypothetical protein JO043_09255 [Candidatus Eremiobacteraeota bacterium]|nr:hypothetical protein [Candidatus Eremiobacteraeota bacterium]
MRGRPRRHAVVAAVAFISLLVAPLHAQVRAPEHRPPANLIPETTPLGGLQWRNIGPAGAGGRVAAVAGTDADPLLYYLGAAGGGVFKTTNGGLTWTDSWNAQHVGAIGALAIAPSNPRIVWVGTGESKPRNDASYGDGIWLSTNGGTSWLHRGLEQSFAIARLLVNSRNPNVVLAGALGDPYRDGGERGVYLTVDAGRTWQRTLDPGPRSGISDMAGNPRDPRVVFAGVWQIRRVPWSFTSGGADDGLYRSLDGGRSWQKLSGNGLPHGILGRIGVAVAPSDPRRVYALIQSKEGTLWRSDDRGEHWRLMTRDTVVNQRPFYMSRLAVDPVNRDRVFFLSENLVETRDGGRTVHDVKTAVHADHHDMWLARDGRRVIEANDGSAPISVDGGQTWDWRFNAVLGQIYHAGYDDEWPFHVCGGLQDNDSFCGPSNSLSPLGILNSNWRDVGNDGDGSWVWPEPGRPTQIWNVGVNEANGQLGIFDLRSRQNLDISPYVRDTNGRPLQGLPYRFNWEAPIAFSARAPGVAYFGGNVVFETRDRGRHWQVISPDLTRNDPEKQQLPGGPINTDVSGAEFYDTILDIAPSPLDGAVIWAGTDDGLIQLTRDGGAHWRNVTMPSIGPWGRVEAVEPSRTSPSSAYAVIDRHLMGDRTPYIFETRDDGAAWSLRTSGLPPNEYARVVREDPRNPNVLYAGLEQGVWISLNRGAHWFPLRLNMPPVSVHDLRVQPRSNALIAATHGRGFWILDDLGPLQHLSAASAGSRPALFAPLAAVHWWLWWKHMYGTGQDECCAPTGEFAGANPDYGALLSYYLPRRVARAPVIEIDDARGKVLRRLPGSRKAGINRLAWDLAEEAPVPWRSAREWNRGPKTGPDVVPGRYTARLIVADAVVAAQVIVEADPRAHWTMQEYVARRDFLRKLDAQLSTIDNVLNGLDARRQRANAGERGQLNELEGLFTSHPVNSEDNLLRRDRLRERLLNLISVVGLSQGPPLPPHEREAAEITSEYGAAFATYRRAALPITCLPAQEGGGLPKKWGRAYILCPVRQGDLESHHRRAVAPRTTSLLVCSRST